MLILLGEFLDVGLRKLSIDIVVAIAGAATISLLAIVGARALAKFRAWPTLRRFRREIRYYRRVPGHWRPSYRQFSGNPSHDGNRPTYHFFVSPLIEVEEFMAFLIPPLDSGHGRQGRGEQSDESELRFNENWEVYLKGIGRQAEKASKRRASSSFRRVIFMDKALLMLFIEQSDLIFKTARMEGKKFLPGLPVSPFEGLARNAVRYAFDIAAIHERVFAHKGVIDGYYLDKSRVLSARYYDFGLYKVGGVDFVYHPIYKKDSSKSIEEQRVFIGTMRRQQRRIDDYRRDFETIWTIATEDRMEQETRLERLKDRYVEEKVYFGEHSLSLNLFNETYYQALNGIMNPRGISVR